VVCLGLFECKIDEFVTCPHKSAVLYTEAATNEQTARIAITWFANNTIHNSISLHSNGKEQARTVLVVWLPKACKTFIKFVVRRDALS
jgi:hypothetical protein